MSARAEPASDTPAGAGSSMDEPVCAEPADLQAPPRRATLGRLLADETGATAIEYALIACFIFLAIVTSLGTLGSKVSASFGAAASGFGAR